MSGTVPEIDRTIGIGVYATPFPGLGRGYGIRAAPDDFVVSEILSPAALRMICDHGAGGNGSNNGNADADASAKGTGYAVYVLRKRGIDTAHALGAIRKMTGAKLKPLGLKDASAATMQYVCSTGAAGRRLRDISASRFGLAFAGYAKRPLTKKQMLGNRFRIRISGGWRDPGSGSNGGDATEAATAPDPSGFVTYADSVPNFYGYQRFGSGRPVTHMVGRALTMGDYDEAVRLILEYASPYDTRERREVRENLADPALYAQSARRLPPGMDTEKTVLEELARHGDPLRALRAVPLLLRRLYVSAYQSYVFNRTLSAAIAAGESLLDPKPGDVCFDRHGDLHKYDGTASAAATAGSGGENGREVDAHGGLVRVRSDAVAIPIVGYSYYSKTRFAPYVSDVLVDEGVKPRAFFLNTMQEASGEGGFRDAVLQCSGYAWHDDAKTVEFSLARGSFATMLLRELIKPPNPISAGF